jgi:protein transport protein SEC24
MLHPLPSPTSTSAAYPPPHSLPPANFPASSHPQPGYSNGYGDYTDLSQQSSTATTPYSSGANSPAFASHHPHPSSYPPQQLQSSSTSAPPANPPRKVDRIDPKQIPRPADLKSSTATIRYYTRSGLSPPSSTADFVAIDEGNCSPRFVRLTTNNIAHEPELIDTTKLCIGAVIQPLAPLAEGEEAVPVIDYVSGPVRCGRCMAYVNPFFQFTDGGNSFICSICQMKGDVPADYRCNLDANGLRRDRQERAELCRGSVEYVVGKDFLTRPVQDPCYLFCIDVSYAAVMSGLTAAAVDAIRHSLEAMKGSERMRAGVMTYDASCHFYALSPPRTEPVMYVMSDVDDVFLPCPSSEILVPLSSPPHLALLLQLLDMVPLMYNRDTRDDEHICSFGAAVSVAAECVMETGGKVLLTVSSLPTQGAGALQMRSVPHREGAHAAAALLLLLPHSGNTLRRARCQHRPVRLCQRLCRPRHAVCSV